MKLTRSAMDLITTIGCYKMVSATKGYGRELHDRCRSEVRARVRRQVWKSAVLHGPQRPPAGRLPQHPVVRELAQVHHLLPASAASRLEIRARRCDLAGLYVENLSLRLAQAIVVWGMAARRMGERVGRR